MKSRMYDDSGKKQEKVSSECYKSHPRDFLNYLMAESQSHFLWSRIVTISAPFLENVLLPSSILKAFS